MRWRTASVLRPDTAAQRPSSGSSPTVSPGRDRHLAHGQQDPGHEGAPIVGVVADGQALAGRAEHHLFVGHQPGQPDGVHPDPARTLPAAGPLQHHLGGGVGRQRAQPGRLPGRGDPLGGVQGGARGGVALLVVVELDHLHAVHERRGQLAEAHQQHGADGEVGRHHGVGRRSVELACQVGHVLPVEAGGAHHDVNSVRRAPGQGPAGGAGLGEVDRHRHARFGQRLEVAGDRQRRDPAPGHLAEVGTGRPRVDGGHQLEVLGLGHRPADLLAHAPIGAHHTDPEHVPTLPGGRRRGGRRPGGQPTPAAAVAPGAGHHQGGQAQGRAGQPDVEPLGPVTEGERPPAGRHPDALDHPVGHHRERAAPDPRRPGGPPRASPPCRPRCAPR